MAVEFDPAGNKGINVWGSDFSRRSTPVISYESEKDSKRNVKDAVVEV